MAFYRVDLESKTSYVVKLLKGRDRFPNNVIYQKNVRNNWKKLDYPLRLLGSVNFNNGSFDVDSFSTDLPKKSRLVLFNSKGVLIPKSLIRATYECYDYDENFEVVIPF